MEHDNHLGGCTECDPCELCETKDALESAYRTIAALEECIGKTAIILKDGATLTLPDGCPPIGLLQMSGGVLNCPALKVYCGESVPYKPTPYSSPG